jgi:hypothetical protein
MWWCTLGRLKQEDCEFKASLGYIARPHLKINKLNKYNKHGSQALVAHNC